MSKEKAVVTVAIPLYKSRRFLEVIIGNIEAIDYPHAEIIVSDRHCADDAIDVLAERFRGDARLKFLRARDGINWPEHYNALLRAASGTYFCWMPHDDSYPPGYVTRLVECLEREPGAVLAYGRMETVDLEGRPVERFMRHELPVAPGARWTPALAARLLMFRYLEVPFRGVFRRDVVMREGLFIRPTARTEACDTYWVFGLALKGRLRFVPECSCRKRFYPTSTHAVQWANRPSLNQVIDGLRVPASYLRDYAGSRRAAFPAYALLVLWALLRLGLLAAWRTRFPPRLRRRLHGLVERLLTK
jgi:glycosyltransferase involved in cell wall biosynthesis